MDRAIRWSLATIFITWAGAAFGQAPDPAASAPAQPAAKEIPLYPGVAK